MKGIEIKKYRKHINKTQEEFADMLGVGKRAVQMWESGERNISQSALLLLQLIMQKDEQNSQLPDLSLDNIDKISNFIYENREQFLNHPLFKQIIKTEIARLEVKKEENLTEAIHENIKQKLLDRIKPTK